MTLILSRRDYCKVIMGKSTCQFAYPIFTFVSGEDTMSNNVTMAKYYSSISCIWQEICTFCGYTAMHDMTQKPFMVHASYTITTAILLQQCVYGCHRKSMNTVLVIMPTAPGHKEVCQPHPYKLIDSYCACVQVLLMRLGSGRWS